MNAHASLLGVFEPGDAWLFRLPVGWKYLLVLTLSIPPLVIGQWWATCGFLVAVLVISASTGIEPRRMLGLGWLLWVLLAVLAGYQLLTLNPAAAIVRPGNILVAVLAARLLTLTTSTPVLMDALATALVPLRLVRVDPEQAALAVALMIRSIPFLIGSVDDARDSARARGLERNPARLLTPVILGAVSYAERTGEALHARGIGDADR
ncbi:energy-coupling factor transporter transmembrane protein EcfT [Tessaracoccus sp. OS52]|uniref:energy-coupling factor transporter transmembrane component T family protein n=1 Tax=Tessaracoccus sp. OS52 TaxID=2886691 RepID=UPI001D0FAEFD|nr:energy-coupling factor transporter transmembrane protein EcfT [Tessaracoccus sp. OS52]MCC2593356.1 energy-coupling factor transporter transmembrane protein EcfT [Tessaracoccus sp. OS52]